MEQLSITFKPSITSAYNTCREFVQARIHQLGKPQKVVAMDMDYSPSDLSRKLAQSPSDSRRFTLDDLEKYISVTGDKEPVVYLVAKYLAHEDPAQIEAEILRLQQKLERAA